MDSLQRLFREVADLDPDRRSQYFDAHEVDEEMRRNVESLLSFDGGGVDFLTEVVGGTVEQFLKAGSEPFAGPYELVRLLGEGGMGSVYLAQRRDGEVDLRVAIKFIRGADSSPLTFRNRFLQERQILARLNHPGITRLLDAGHTASGQPFLVMEYVDGVPIDIYCKDFGFEAKLVLFLGVCDAVAYLHRNLVIHRDLKPSKILVQADGFPKVLDFGIAKIIDDASDQGITKERILTPEYASPEQVKGTATTTATDIYSLGAVLYALLTGQSPHATQAKDESVEERIITGVPASVRTTHPRLPRDLDYVVRKALRKEPVARYGTVDALAEDLRAVLEARPVKARSGDASYRLRKFARRQWLPLLALASAKQSEGRFGDKTPQGGSIVKEQECDCFFSVGNRDRAARSDHACSRNDVAARLDEPAVWREHRLDDVGNPAHGYERSRCHYGGLSNGDRPLFRRNCVHSVERGWDQLLPATFDVYCGPNCR